MYNLPRRANPRRSAVAFCGLDWEMGMKTGVQSLVNEVVGYGMGTALNRAIGLIIALIYPILLSRDEYGRMDVIFSVPSLLVVLFLVGFDSTLARFFYEPGELLPRKRLVSTAFYAALGIAVLISGILLAAARPIALSLFNDPRYVLYFRIVVTAMPFLIASHINLVVLRLERRVQLYNLILAGNLVLSAVIGIFSIRLFHIGVTGVLIGFLTGHVATSILATIINRRYLSAMPGIRRLPELLGFGLPLMFSGMAFWFIGYVNRPMLAHQVSADELGLFAIASGGVNVMALLIAAFRNAWHPFAFSIMGQADSGRVYGRTLTLFTFIGATIAVCGTLMAPQALLLINAYTRKNWSGAAISVGPLAMGILFNAMYFVVQTGIYIARRTSVIAWTVGSAAIASILFNAVLIPAYGIFGAALATALGHLTALVLLYLAAQRIAPIPYQNAKLASIILAAVTVIVLDYQLQAQSIANDLAIKAVLLAAYCATLLAVRAVTLKDIALLWNGIGKALGTLRSRLKKNREERHADSH